MSLRLSVRIRQVQWKIKYITSSQFGKCACIRHLVHRPSFGVWKNSRTRSVMFNFKKKKSTSSECVEDWVRNHFRCLSQDRRCRFCPWKSDFRFTAWLRVWMRMCMQQVRKWPQNKISFMRLHIMIQPKRTSLFTKAVEVLWYQLCLYLSRCDVNSYYPASGNIAQRVAVKSQWAMHINTSNIWHEQRPSFNLSWWKYGIAMRLCRRESRSNSRDTQVVEFIPVICHPCMCSRVWCYGTDRHNFHRS